MSRSFAASARVPARSMASRRSALPGPRAIASPWRMRRRGRSVLASILEGYSGAGQGSSGARARCVVLMNWAPHPRERNDSDHSSGDLARGSGRAGHDPRGLVSGPAALPAPQDAKKAEPQKKEKEKEKEKEETRLKVYDEIQVTDRASDMLGVAATTSPPVSPWPWRSSTCSTRRRATSTTSTSRAS